MRHLPYLLNDLPKSCWILEIRMYTLPKNEYSHLTNWWLGDGPFPFPSFSFLGPGKFQGRIFFFALPKLPGLKPMHLNTC